MTVYVEWVEGGGNPATSDLTVKAACNNEPLDTLKFHPFQSIIVGLGGFTETSASAGTFSAAQDLYREGYDAYWFTHGDYERALSETKTGLTYRGVQNVAMWGYSFGGNRIYDVSKGIKEAGFSSAIRYTAYIDAIDIDPLEQPIPPFTIAERAKPPGSPIHDSYYQREYLQLRGNSTNNELQGLAATYYDSEADLLAGGYVTPVTSVDLSDTVEPNSDDFAGSHSAIDRYTYVRGFYKDRTLSIVPNR